MSAVRLPLLATLLLVACRPGGPGADGGAGGGTGGSGAGGGEACTPSLTVGTPLRLLTRVEYDNTVRDLLGTTARPARDLFPREPVVQSLDNDATVARVTGEHVARYLEASEALAADTVANRRGLVVPCATEDLACGEQFIATTGMRAFRRPLSTEERANLNTLFSATLGADGFAGAVELTLQAMLQSPQFLYRDEQALAPVPMPKVTLGAWEVASRLSYFLWATAPDAELLDAAANGVLDTREGVHAQAVRMLADPRAMDGLMRLFSLWLMLDAVEGTEKTPAAYPEFTPALAKAWRTSLELFVRDVLEKQGTLAGLLSSNALFTNDAMGMYGPAAPSAAFVRNEMAGTVRGGLLTQPGFLAFKSLPDMSSPVRRGIFVLDKLMCEPPPPPPAGANITPPSPSTSETTRQRFSQHSTDPACAGCHQFIDPVGFTFEHYDGLGRWRDTENGHPIDASGGVLVSRESTLVGPAADVIELSQRLAQSRRVHDCVAKEFYRFALGRPLNAADTCTVTQVGDRFMGSGGDFKALMLAIVDSDAFVTNANPEMTP